MQNTVCKSIDNGKAACQKNHSGDIQSPIYFKFKKLSYFLSLHMCQNLLLKTAMFTKYVSILTFNKIEIYKDYE